MQPTNKPTLQTPAGLSLLRKTLRGEPLGDAEKEAARKMAESIEPKFRKKLRKSLFKKAIKSMGLPDPMKAAANDPKK